MNREQIISMAREAGIIHPEMVDKTLERFAALVASAERERIKQANAPEIERVNAHIKELEDACKKPEQEPVAWYRDEDGIRIYYETKCWDDAIPLYTAPQHTWVGLTDEEKKDFWTADQMTQEEWQQLFAAIEAALKAKNT